VLGALVLGSMALVGCGSKSGSDAAPKAAQAEPSTTIDISDLGKPVASTTTSTTSTTIPVDDGCGAVRTIFLEPAGDPARIGPVPTGAALDQLVGKVEMRLPPAERVQFRALMAFENQLKSNPGAQAPAGLDPPAIIVHLIKWSSQECPPKQPAWACVTRSTFHPVGAPVDRSGGTFATPEETVQSTFDGGAGSIALGQTQDTAWFGWTDDTGLINRVQQVVHSGNGWQFGDDTSCSSHGSAGETSETVGNAIFTPTTTTTTTTTTMTTTTTTTTTTTVPPTTRPAGPPVTMAP